MNKRAIVIGATGLVGRALTDQLAEAAHITEVVTLTRRPVGHQYPKVKNHVVDFDDLDSCAEWFSADSLFSCLGTTRKQAGSLAAQRSVDLEYQYKAAKLAVGNGVKHYLLVSSYGADASSANPYLKMKGELEARVLTLAFERISIFQPSLLLGPRQNLRFGETLASWVLPGLCHLPPLRRFRPVTGQQVAEKMTSVSQQRGQAQEWFRLDEMFLE